MLTRQMIVRRIPFWQVQNDAPTTATRVTTINFAAGTKGPHENKVRLAGWVGAREKFGKQGRRELWWAWKTLLGTVDGVNDCFGKNFGEGRALKGAKRERMSQLSRLSCGV